MKTITVAQLRQNPTEALADVESGETYVVTRHRRPVAKLVPPDDSNRTLLALIPAKHPRPAHLSSRRAWQLKTAATIADLLADMDSDR